MRKRIIFLLLLISINSKIFLDKAFFGDDDDDKKKTKSPRDIDWEVPEIPGPEQYEPMEPIDNGGCPGVPGPRNPNPDPIDLIEKKNDLNKLKDLDKVKDLKFDKKDIQFLRDELLTRLDKEQKNKFFNTQDNNFDIDDDIDCILNDFDCLDDDDGELPHHEPY